MFCEMIKNQLLQNKTLFESSQSINKNETIPKLRRFGEKHLKHYKTS